MVDTTKKNGTASAAEAKGANGIHTVKPADKVIPTSKVTIAETPQPVTLVTQREKAEKLNLLFAKEEKLTATRKEIDRFQLATDESTNMLELKDGKGAQFRTSNPTLIKTVIGDIINELVAKQKQISDDIIAVG